MAYVAVVIGGDAADVELDLALFKGDKGRFLTGFGIVDLDTHGLFQRVDMHNRESSEQERRCSSTALTPRVSAVSYIFADAEHVLL